MTAVWQSSSSINNMKHKKITLCNLSLLRPLQDLNLRPPD